MSFKLVLVLVALCAAMDLSIALTFREYIDFISNHNTEFDISVKISDTYEECCRMCTEIPGCNYWSYLYAAPLHNICWLKTRYHGYTHKLGFLNGFKNPVNCPAKSQNMTSTPPPLTTTPLTPMDLALYKENIEFIKNYKINKEYDISVSMTATEEDCCTMCTETPACNFWTFSNGPVVLNVCWLKLKYQKYVIPGFINNLKTQEHCPAKSQNMTSTPPPLTTTSLIAIDKELYHESIDYVTNYKINKEYDISVSMTATIEDCCTMCTETPACEAWTYSNGPVLLNVCWIKYRIQAYVILGFVNGFKSLEHCPAKSG